MASNSLILPKALNPVHQTFLTYFAQRYERDPISFACGGRTLQNFETHNPNFRFFIIGPNPSYEFRAILWFQDKPSFSIAQNATSPSCAQVNVIQTALNVPLTQRPKSKTRHLPRLSQPPQTFPVIGEKIIPFSGKQNPLSNMYPTLIKYQGEEFKSAEHAYVVTFSRYFGFLDAAEIIKQLSDPMAVKQQGKSRVKNKLPSRAYFESKWYPNPAFTTMISIARRKFKSPDLRRHLINTYPAYLVEATTDTRWAIGQKLFPHETRKLRNLVSAGTNWMGEILMQVRTEIMAETSASTGPTG